MTSENIKKVAEKFNFANEEDMYAAVGYNGITALQVANRLTEKLRKNGIKNKSKILRTISDLKDISIHLKRRESGVRVSGIDNLLFVYQDAVILFLVMKLLVLLRKAGEFLFIRQIVQILIQ